MSRLLFQSSHDLHQLKMCIRDSYGMVISLCKKESKYFDSSQFKIKKHTDKQRIKSKFDKIQAEYEKEGCLIRDIVECLFANGFIPEAVKNDFEAVSYTHLIGICSILKNGMDI